jgi:hypothetical protein
MDGYEFSATINRNSLKSKYLINGKDVWLCRALRISAWKKRNRREQRDEEKKKLDTGSMSRRSVWAKAHLQVTLDNFQPYGNPSNDALLLRRFVIKSYVRLRQNFISLAG